MLPVWNPILLNKSELPIFYKVFVDVSTISVIKWEYSEDTNDLASIGRIWDKFQNLMYWSYILRPLPPPSPIVVQN